MGKDVILTLSNQGYVSSMLVISIKFTWNASISLTSIDFTLMFSD